MDIKENSFYRRIDISKALGIYPQFKDFAGNSDELVTLKGGMGATTFVLSGSTPPALTFGQGELVGGGLRVLASGANLTNAAKIPKLELYKIRKGIPIVEGSQSMATGTDGTYTAGENLYVAGVYIDGESTWHEENFDGSDKSIGAVIPIRTIGTSTVTFEDAYLDIDDAKDPYLGGDSFPWGGNTKSNIQKYFSDKNGKVPVKPDNKKRFRGKWVPRIDTRNKKQKWEITKPQWKFDNIKGDLRFAKSETVATTIETTVEASKNNTMFDFIKMSPNQTNPYTFNTTTNPMIYTTVELTTGKKETGGQAMRIYHNWTHVSNVTARQRVEALFAAGADSVTTAGTSATYIPAIPQVAVLGITNVPRPAIIDMDYAGRLQAENLTHFDKQAVMPEINFKMNIAKLPPNPMTSVASGDGGTYGKWSTRSVTQGGPKIVGRVLGQVSSSAGVPEYGFYCNLQDSATGSAIPVNQAYLGGSCTGTVAPGTDNFTSSGSGDSRIYTYQRGIVCVLATREPSADEKTLDEYLVGLYDEGVTFGGIQMFSYANPDPGTGSVATNGITHTGQRLPSAPGGGPWNTGTSNPLLNVDTPSVWIKPIPIVPLADKQSYQLPPTGGVYPMSGATTHGTIVSASSSLANNGGLMECVFDKTSVGVYRKKLVFHESPGYWLGGKVSSSAGADHYDASGNRWKWSTQNWARVLKDSWFNVKFVFNPFTSSSAQQYAEASGGQYQAVNGSGGSMTGVSVRAYFESDFSIRTAQTAKSSEELDEQPGSDLTYPTKKFVPYVNIPMFSKDKAASGSGGFCLFDPKRWPKCITWWFMNYRWCGSADAPTGEKEQLWYGGDNILQPDGGDMELEAYMDNIEFKNWNTEVDNASVGRGEFTSMLKMQNHSVITPKRADGTLQAGEGGGFMNSGCFTTADTAYNVLIGLKNRDDLPITETRTTPGCTMTAGVFQFNNFSTQQFKNLERMAPGSTFMNVHTDLGAGYVDDLDGYPMNRLGNQLGPYFGKDSEDDPTHADVGWEYSGKNIKWDHASFSGQRMGGSGAGGMPTQSGSFPSWDGANAAQASGTGFYMATGENNYLSTDGLCQKGMVGVQINRYSGYAATGSLGTPRPRMGEQNWYPREHILASARIMAIPGGAAAGASNIAVDRNFIEVDKPEIFNTGDPDEEYIIYKYFSYLTAPELTGGSATNKALGFTTSLKLAEKESRDGDNFYFNVADITKSDAGTTFMEADDIGDLWISPKRVWFHMHFGNIDDTDTYNKPLQTPRVYESVSLLANASTSLLPSSSDMGTTYDEYLYTYATGEQGEKGKSAPYQRTWNLMQTSEDTDLILNVDYGYGTYDEEENEGGQLGIQPALINTSGDPARYIEFPLSGLVQQNKPAPNEYVLFKMGLADEIDISEVSLYGDEYTGITDYKPHIIWEYKDELPKFSEFTVSPAADVISEDVNLYELTTEPLNSVKFNWSEEGDDMWYRMLFIDTGSINNKYHRAQLYVPLNEGPLTIGSGATNYWYNYTGTTITSGAVTISGTDGAGVKADIEGLAGFCASYNTSGGNDGYSVIHHSSNTSVSGTNYTVVLHAIPGDAADSNFLFSYGSGSAVGGGMDVALDGAGKIRVRHSGTYLTGTSIVIADNQTPVSVVVIHRNESSDGKDLKLYVNGSLEDYYGGTLANITASANTAIGGQDGQAGYMFQGKIEEVIVYNHAAWVPESTDEFIMSTTDLPYDAARSNVYQAKLYGFDYHNIRGRSDTQVASTNQISWKVTKA